jgi:zinc protease
MPVRTILPQGVVVIAKETRTIPAVTISLMMRAGSIYDPADASGAVFLLSRVIDRGTTTRSAAAIAEDLDNRGITLAVNVTRHTVSFVSTCLAEDFEPVFALLSDIVTSPSFPQDDDNPAVRAVESLMGLLYPDPHPYGRRTKGTVDTVDALTRERLLRLHAERFAPAALTVVVVGDVPAGRATHVAERAFGGWSVPPPAQMTLPRFMPSTVRRRLVIPMMNKVQADVAYGFTAVARSDPAYYACWLMNNALGQYSMGGRLGDSIRERLGMAYYAFSSLDANVAEGPLTVRAGVSPANVDRAVSSIDYEIERLARDGITAKELSESRQYLIGSIPRSLETNTGIAAFLQTAEFFGLGPDYDVRLPGLLRDVTLDDVHAVARRLLDPDRATVVIAGPYEDRGIG